MASSSNERPGKRLRTTLQEQIANTGLQIATQARHHEVSRRSVAEELHKHDNVETLHGRLYGSLSVATTDGGTLDVVCVNPFAFLWYMASMSVIARDFLVEHLTGKTCKIAFYNDSVTPGNVLRPDAGRTFEAFYWTFMDFPDWFRSKASQGWFAVAFVAATSMAKVKGGIAALAKAFVKLFFNPDEGGLNFERTGVLLPTSGGDRAHVRATFGAWLADEKAIKEIVCCKGASGIKACVSCKNVVNRTTPEAGDYLVHISEPQTDRFDSNEPQDLTNMVCELQAKYGAVPKSEFAFLEKAFGLCYVPEGILFDEYTRNVVQFPRSIFWDWMHCLLASGGVAQYECNQFARALTRAGISLKQIDDFCSNIAVPEARSKLGNTFFSDRVVNKNDAHMRAFASEMLSVISQLGIFVDAVVKPAGAVTANVKCFDWLRQIVRALTVGDQAVGKVELLKRALFEHHECFARAYPGCVKPKIHYLKHSVGCIERLRCNLSCFAPERKHKDAKRVAAYSYNKVPVTIYRSRNKPHSLLLGFVVCFKVGQSVLVRVTYDFFNDVADGTCFRKYIIGNPVKMPAWAQAITSTIVGDAIVSESLSTPCGIVKVGDVVWLTSPCRLATVKLAVRFGGTSKSHRFILIVECFALLPCGAWSNRTSVPDIVEASFVATTCCALILDGRVYV